jgi:hypothetical protein
VLDESGPELDELDELELGDDVERLELGEALELLEPGEEPGFVEPGYVELGELGDDVGLLGDIERVELLLGGEVEDELDAPLELSDCAPAALALRMRLELDCEPVVDDVVDDMEPLGLVPD